MTIYDAQGRIRASVVASDKSSYRKELMGEEMVTLCFNSDTLIPLRVGDYILTGFGRFEIVRLDRPETSSRNSRGYQYSQRFHAPWAKWENHSLVYDRQGACEISWKMTHRAAYFGDVVCSNLRTLGLGEYSFVTDNDEKFSQMHLLSFDGTGIVTALNTIAKEWDAEWWIEGNNIRLGRCEYGTEMDLQVGDIITQMTAQQSDNQYCTRLFVFGSTRNLPANYRKGETTGDAIEAVVERRLKLPEGTPYIDAWEDMAPEDVVEGVYVNDNIYPRREGVISSLSTVTYTDETETEGGGKLLTDWQAYRYRDTGITFKESYRLPDRELRIVFQSGALSGMDFEVVFNPLESTDPQEQQLWEIVRSEDYGIPLPSDDFHPSDGDRFVLYGFDSTKIGEMGLITAAEEELLQEGRKALRTMSIDPTNYVCPTNPVRCAGMRRDAQGRQVYNPTDVVDFDIGQAVRLVNEAYFYRTGGVRSSRVRAFEKNLNNPYQCTYTVGESTRYSVSGSLQAQIDAITTTTSRELLASGGNLTIIRRYDKTPPTDTNVFSALRSKSEFISKGEDDSAYGLITFLNGLKSEGTARFLGSTEFGRFSSGLNMGTGGAVDDLGNAELESLRLRSWLEVPELRYNRAEVILGDQWRAAGGGIIESVTVDVDANNNPLRTGTITLKLEDGEIGAVAVDDICKGYFHDFKTPANNATSDVDDSRGNTKFAGFCTIFFRVTEVLSSDGTNKRFRYMLRSESARWPHSFHPFEGMHFVAYGNFTRTDRQKSAYETRTYTRHLVGVNDWEFSDSMIAMQFGDLSNLSVFGLQMAGYSAYLNNIYMIGTIRQINANLPITLDVVTNTGDTFIADGELLDLECSVKRGFDDLTADVTSWLIERDSGNAHSDADWNAAHTSFDGNITLSQFDIGSDIYSANSLFTITANGDGWSVSRTIAVRTLSIGSRRTMRFVSEYGEFDSFISFGDTVHFFAIIEDALRNDYTSEYTGWTIQRHNGDSADDIASDGVWNATRASIDNNGGFYLTWSDSQDDLQAERATFIVEAQLISNQSISVVGKLSI